MKRLSKQQLDEIIRLYQSGIPPLKIGEQFGIKNNSVTRIIRKSQLPRTQLIQVSSGDIKQIIADYSAGISSEVIAKKLNIDGSTVCRILKRNGVAIRPATENKRKYKIDQDFFEIINTEEKAYFLGLMYADGNLSKGGTGIKICLQEEDKDILEKFSNIIYGFVKMYQGEGTLEDGTIRTYFTFPIYCQKTHQDLVKLGCPPDKTFDIRFPTKDIVPEDLLVHFIRGYLDGDGCICNADPGKPVIDITSNYEFVYKLHQYLTDKLSIYIQLYRSNRNEKTGNIQIAGFEKNKVFLEYLYRNATVYMSRKYQYYLDMLQLDINRLAKKSKKHLNIEAYGTTYIPEYNQTLLLGKNLKKLSNIDKALITDYLFDFYRMNGFPYHKLNNNELIKDFNSISKINALTIEKENKTLTVFHQSGLNVVKHFSPQFYEVNSADAGRMSMLDTFNDDDLLRKVIRNRIDGEFNMTGNMLKQGLANSKLAYKASIYNPMIAKFVYQKFSQPNDIVYDFSMGFGHRLLGALSVEHPLTYVGVDPMQRTVNGNNSLFSFFDQNVPGFNKKVELYCIGSENYCDSKYEGKVSLAFSCPPYFNIEKYEDDPSQAYFDNSYVNFINNWWRQTAQNIVKLLKVDGIMALNVQDIVDGFNLGKDMCNVLKEYGLVLIDTYQVQITRNTSFGRSNGKHKYEPIYIFKKAAQ